MRISSRDAEDRDAFLAEIRDRQDGRSSLPVVGGLAAATVLRDPADFADAVSWAKSNASTEAEATQALMVGLSNVFATYLYGQALADVCTDVRQGTFHSRKGGALDESMWGHDRSYVSDPRPGEKAFVPSCLPDVYSHAAMRLMHPRWERAAVWFRGGGERDLAPINDPANPLHEPWSWMVEHQRPSGAVRWSDFRRKPLDMMNQQAMHVVRAYTDAATQARLLNHGGRLLSLEDVRSALLGGAIADQLHAASTNPVEAVHGRLLLLTATGYTWRQRFPTAETGMVASAVGRGVQVRIPGLTPKELDGKSWCPALISHDFPAVFDGMAGAREVIYNRYSFPSLSLGTNCSAEEWQMEGPNEWFVESWGSATPIELITEVVGLAADDVLMRVHFTRDQVVADRHGVDPEIGVQFPTSTGIYGVRADYRPRPDNDFARTFHGWCHSLEFAGQLGSVSGGQVTDLGVGISAGR